MRNRILTLITVFLITVSAFGNVYAEMGVGRDPYLYPEYEFGDFEEKTEVEEEIRINAEQEAQDAGVEDVSNVILPNNSEDARKIIGFFNKMGILLQNYNVYDKLTRSQAAAIIANFFSYETDFSSFRGSKFSDINSATYGYNEIYFLYAQGAMNGVSDFLFAPDESFTYDQAITVIVRLLGQDLKAKANGGYPTGYRSAAVDLGITSKVNFSSESNLISMGAFCTMLMNIADVPINDNYITNDGNKLYGDSSRTVLNDSLHITKAKGIITSANNININGINEHLKTDEIKIDDVLYKITDEAYKTYLGCNVEFYFKNDITAKEIPEIMYIDIASGVKRKTVSSNDFYYLNENTLGYYDESDKIVKLSVKNPAKIIYNGIQKPSFSKELVPDNGKVVFISNNGTKTCDIIFIYDYESFVVKQSNNGKISFMYNEIFKGDRKNKNYIKLDEYTPYTLIKNGEYASIDDVTANNSVSICYTDNVGYIVEVYDKIIEDEISSTKDAPYQIFIDGTYYPVYSRYLTLSKSSGAVQPELGLYASFVINPFGNVVGVLDSASELMYYGLAVGVLKLGVFDDEYKIKVIRADDGLPYEYTLKEKLTVNGVENVEVKKVFDDLDAKINNFKNNFDDEQVRNNPPIIKMKFFKKGVIDWISYDIVGFTDDISVQDRSFVRLFDYSQKRLLVGYKCIDNKYLFSESDTFVIRIPNSLKDEDFKAGTIRGAFGNVDERHYFVAYDPDQFGVSKFIISYGEIAKTVNVKSNVMCVEGIAQVMDDDENIVYKIDGYSTLGAVSYITQSDEIAMNAAKNLEKGDVIHYELNDKNKITVIAKQASYDETTIYNYTNNVTADSQRDRKNNFGEVLDFNDNFIKIKYYNPESTTEEQQSYQGLAKANIIVYDGEKIYSGNNSDISNGDKIYLIEYITGIQQCVIYKYE